MVVLRTPTVIRVTGLSRTTLWRLERQGEFPARIRLGPNSIGWRAEDIARWIDARPRGMTSTTPNQRGESARER